MKYVLNIKLNYVDDFELDTVLTTNEDIDVSLYEKEFFLDILGNKSIKDIFKNNDYVLDIKKDLENLLKMYKEDNDQIMMRVIKEQILIMNSTMEDLFCKCDTVFIEGSINEIIDYVKENPEIAEKKIVIKNTYSIAETSLKQAQKDVEKIYNETNITCSIVIDGNQEPVTIDEFMKVFEIIDDIVKQIKSLNMSQLEQIMFVYDIVRGRIYREEEKNELYSKSRNIASVLLGQYIVCAGYTNLFNTILEKLNIKCGCYFLDSLNKDESGHVRSVIYIQDDKYEVEGIYLFDPTMDSKQNDEDIDYINMYFAFAKTFTELSRYDDLQNLIPKNRYLIKNNYEELKNILNDTVTVDNILRNRLIVGINSLLELLRNEKVDIKDFNNKPKEYVIEFYKELYKKCNKTMSLSTFTKLVINVKRLEYYINSSTYSFDVKSLDLAIRSYIKSQPNYVTAEEYLNHLLFDVSISKIINDRYRAAYNLIDEKEIEAVKFTKTLRNFLEQKRK